MEEVKLEEIRHEYEPTERVCDWQFIELKDRHIRVYYKAKDEIGLGFLFYAVEIVGYSNDVWALDSHSECMYQGIAYFDGIRHLYMGDEKTKNYGYHYYATLEANIETLKVIRELEKKYCRDFE